MREGVTPQRFEEDDDEGATRIYSRSANDSSFPSWRDEVELEIDDCEVTASSQVAPLDLAAVRRRLTSNDDGKPATAPPQYAAPMDTSHAMPRTRDREHGIKAAPHRAEDSAALPVLRPKRHLVTMLLGLAAVLGIALGSASLFGPSFDQAPSFDEVPSFDKVPSLDDVPQLKAAHLYVRRLWSRVRDIPLESLPGYEVFVAEFTHVVSARPLASPLVTPPSLPVLQSRQDDAMSHPDDPRGITGPSRSGGPNPEVPSRSYATVAADHDPSLEGLEPASTPRRALPGEKAPRSSSTRAPRQAALPVGVLRLNAQPWAEIFIDGKLRGHTPQMHLELSLGRHHVSLKNTELGLIKNFEITIAAGETETRIVSLADP